MHNNTLSAYDAVILMRSRQTRIDNLFEQIRRARELKSMQALRSTEPILDRIGDIDRGLVIAALLNDAKSPKPDVSERAKTALIAMGEAELIKPKKVQRPIPVLQGIDPILARAALTNDTRHPNPVARSFARAVLSELAAGVVIVMFLIAPIDASASDTKPKQVAVQIDKDAIAGKAFDNAVKQLGKLSEQSIKAIAEIRAMVIAVATGKEIKTKQPDEACELGCLGKKKEIDPETGEFVEEAEESGRVTDYQFSIGDAKTAQRFGNALKLGMSGLKDVKVNVEGDTITVKNTDVRSSVDF